MKDWKFKIAHVQPFFYTRIEFYIREMDSSQTMSHKSFEILKNQYNFLANLIINLYSLN